MYKGLIKNTNIVNEIAPFKFICNYNDGAYLEVKSSTNDKFRVDFTGKNGLEYSTEIGSNMWCKTNKKYFEEYTCVVTNLKNNKVVFVDKYNATNKRVYITLESKSLGDTMAWFPYIDEFRKKWNCHVVCSTFHNKLFIEQYPELEFVTPGTIVPDLYATYRVGLFFDNGQIDSSKHKNNPTKISLLQLATDILGLDYNEVRPKLKKSNITKSKRVGIGMHSTAQTKYWNNPDGWQEVTDFLISQGYEVVMISKEEDGYMGNFYPKGITKLQDSSLEDVIEYLQSCEFFIGISSGLSWLAWAVNIPVVLISGFTGEYLEPSDNVIRVLNKSVCNDCWSRHKFDPGDWNWCPDHKGSIRQFECSKSITSDMVIEKMREGGLVGGVVEKINTVIFYSDLNYEYQANALINSILKNGDGLKMYYYTIGFESSLDFEGLTKVVIPIDEKWGENYRLEFYKPSVILKHIEMYGGKALFFDTDIIVGRRFNIDFFENKYDYPLFPTGNWSHPFSFYGNEKYDETNLMKYFGVNDKSMEYIYSNIVSFSEKCKDFVEEWVSICDNRFLLSKKRLFFPFSDETAANIVLWKRNIRRNLGRVYLNTTLYEPFEFIEENDNIKGDPNINNGIMGSDLLRCDNSSQIMLYHGMKDKDVLNKVGIYQNKKENI
jgi:autotransporter strand-loop-strand O-heptosyltransferase